MSVIKVHLRGDMDRLQERFRSMADDLFRMSQPTTKCRFGWIPAVDLFTAENRLFLVAALGGVDRNSIELTLNNRYLKLSGFRRSPVNIDKKHYFQMEIEYGPFERIVRLPFDVDTGDVCASYENGLLIIEMNRKTVDAVNVEIS